jgi:hypothetical protein
MSKTVKKIIIFAISLIVVLAIIFAISILVSSSKKDDSAQKDTTISDSADNTDDSTQDSDKTTDDDSSQQTEPDGDSTLDDSFFNEQFEPEEKDEPEQDLELTDIEISVDAPSDEYDTTKEAGHIRCVRYDNGAYIDLEAVSGSDAEQMAPSFLDDNNISYNSIEYKGEESLGNTQYSAETITATDGTMHCDGYLIDADGCVVCIVAYYPENDESSRISINSVLDTLVIRQS